jgi:two-component system response regulator AtoC
MWFGTQEGLSRYDGRHFVNFTTKDGLANDSVFAVHRDTDGIMWFATWGGISRYDGSEFVNLTVEDGLAHDMAVAIHQEPGGNLWFGTHAGVSRYNGVAWTSLDARDGLAGKSVSSICQDSDGTLWFATEDGITRYRRSIVPPGIRIVSMKINGEDTDPEAIPPIIVGSHVSIEYSAIDFKTVPEKRQYCCCVYETGDMRRETSDMRRETSDIRHQTSDSRPGTSDPEVESQVSSLKSHVPYNPPTKETTFDWIPQEPGTYIFQVQAIDRDLNYSEPATLSLTVQPDPVIVSMQTELNHLRREVVEKYHFENIIGRSASIRQVRALMERAIDSGLTALIIGETGTGKELVAKAIHYNSPRKGKPLLARNCGAIPKDLLASDLFGHRKGAFTGATEDKMGLFEAASGGTVLLDEISEMPEDAQIHLLRVLQEREVQRLGEYASREVDVRIIAMTNRDLAEEVKADRFREDLYHRLNEFPIHIPPLREHSEDIPLLAEHFLNEYSQEQKQEPDDFAPEVFDMLQSYTWPGNVRELRNVIRRAVALAEEGRQIQTYHFPPQITHGESLIQEVLSDQLNYTDSVIRFRRRFIEEILRECDGNRSEAARRLGMDRSNLRNLMKRLGVKE